MIGRSGQRLIIITAAAAFAVLLLVSLAFSKYVHISSELEDKFVMADHGDPEVSDTVSLDTATSYYYKSGLSVTAPDKGYPVYIRVALVPTWRDASGNIYGQQPIEGSDYSLSYNSDKWYYNIADGYYYCRQPVQSGAQSPMLIKNDQRLEQIADPPVSGLTLHVEVTAQCIQAAGKTSGDVKAVVDAWGIDPSAQ